MENSRNQLLISGLFRALTSAPASFSFRFSHPRQNSDFIPPPLYTLRYVALLFFSFNELPRTLRNSRQFYSTSSSSSQRVVGKKYRTQIHTLRAASVHRQHKTGWISSAQTQPFSRAITQSVFIDSQTHSPFYSLLYGKYTRNERFGYDSLSYITAQIGTMTNPLVNP